MFLKSLMFFTDSRPFSFRNGRCIRMKVTEKCRGSDFGAGARQRSDDGKKLAPIENKKAAAS